MGYSLYLTVGGTYAIGERHRYGNHRSSVTLNSKGLRENEDAAELAVGRIEKPVTEKAVGIDRERRGRGRHVLT